jgi:hypothetical protein
MYSTSVLKVYSPKVLLLFQQFLIVVYVASQVKLKNVHNGNNLVKYISHRHSEEKKHEICLKEH